mmetsp:Transcript_129/g.262  ORF Transcript_129/g.262 Transcript_129/m.262 type:complete len:86 (+) Transcript_129:614-871(+)
MSKHHAYRLQSHATDIVELGEPWYQSARCSRLASFAGLQPQHFADIAHALALVRIRFMETSNGRSDVPNLLLVRSIDYDGGLRRH